ncbi:hypothetical protein SAY87_003954 [Trapa incisa]|uniref:Uncharacterized protein n=1 Tax=Trapa incisa TaxID=236973 RepID=A0AAN7JNJ6_9MYRT|nr:hypothetical protein SAY87_003954 [Trapa incisa]
MHGAPMKKQEMQTAIPSGNEARDQHARAGGRKLKIRKTLSHRGEASKVTTSCSSVDSAAAAVERKVVACQSSQLVRGKPGTFVPFSADYHVPRPHPPKNN